MSNYDNKLGEWFKRVQEREQQLKAKKNVDEVPAPKEAQPIARDLPQVRTVNVEEPVREATSQAISTVQVIDEVAVDTSLINAPRTTVEVEEQQPSSVLFDEKDTPPVEDFFSFLSRSREKGTALPEEMPEFEIPHDRGGFNLSEGTGEPRPINTNPRPSIQPSVQPTVRPEPRSEQPPVIMRSEVVLPSKPERKPEPKPRAARVLDTEDNMQERWERMPHHLQTLFGGIGDEVAQNSYQAFRESRGELIQRLLDPVISLEEAARVLNVCPTTVRRYTNRGALEHLRTAGNQRRFRLSDVLAFMEKNSRKAKTSEKAASVQVAE